MKPGDQIKMLPHTDHWMRGDRFGVIVDGPKIYSMERPYWDVMMEVSGKVYSVNEADMIVRIPTVTGNTVEPPRRNVAVLVGALLIIAIVTIVALLIRAGGHIEDRAYESGMYDGAHDLCQEVGGTWVKDDGGWCRMP